MSEPQEANSELRFENAYDELTEIIDQLESGDLSLDESMTLFERGRTLVLFCEKQLNTAELRVSQLLANNDGSFRIDLLS
ncbi:MAG: exodeoxyribonuclease VII small subunit [Chloroflexota bacterium]